MLGPIGILFLHAVGKESAAPMALGGANLQAEPGVKLFRRLAEYRNGAAPGLAYPKIKS